MPYYFRPFPLTTYDIKKNGEQTLLTNITARFKLVEAFQRQEAVYYEYSVKEGERADTIAFKYYGDPSLDWIIYLTNDIVDPDFEWPLSNQSLKNFIVKKYGSITAAMEQTHHYEQIIQQHEVLFDGTIIPAEYEEIDLTTYNSLAAAEKRIVTSYEYEVDANESKRSIKLLSEDFVAPLLSQVKRIFE